MIPCGDVQNWTPMADLRRRKNVHLSEEKGSLIVPLMRRTHVTEYGTEQGVEGDPYGMLEGNLGQVPDQDDLTDYYSQFPGFLDALNSWYDQLMGPPPSLPSLQESLSCSESSVSWPEDEVVNTITDVATAADSTTGYTSGSDTMVATTDASGSDANLPSLSEDATTNASGSDGNFTPLEADELFDLLEWIRSRSPGSVMTSVL